MTQCESHFARSIFPCIDEPAAKAAFQLTLTHPSDHTVLSNTDILLSKSSSAATVTTFEMTPPMSTYLFAFVAGAVGYTERYTERGVRVSLLCDER